MTRSAVVVGSAGQDGTLLTRLLATRGYGVIGLARGDLDILSPGEVAEFIARHRPAELYFLAACHHSSETLPAAEGDLFRTSMRVHFDAAVNFLDAIYIHSPLTRFFYAASSHVFGPPANNLQNEDTPLQPDSIYGITKAAALMACRRYREAKGIFASVGILYNHESNLRGEEFVSRKIAKAVARIARAGRRGTVVLGDLQARADWGYAPDYVDAMNRILQLDQPADFVVATGETHTVAEFAEIAFAAAQMDYRAHVTAQPAVLARRNPPRVGDASRLRKATDWRPSLDFATMVRRLVEVELERLDAQ